MKTKLKNRTLIMLMVTGYMSLVFGAEPTKPGTQLPAEQSEQGVQLPTKGSSEYWNVRSEAISEFLPFLTKKRSEIKSLNKILADYLLTIDKASDFAAKNVPVPEDPDVYFEILHIGQGLKDMNIPKPKTRPSWNDLLEVVMKHVVYEGYLPTAVETDEMEHYVQICKQKEQYGQKVRNDLRGVLDQCARMWVYLKSIGKLDEFKVHYADLALQQDMQKTQAKAQYTAQHRDAMMQRQAEAEQAKFDEAQAREEFASSQKERRYDDRQGRLEYRQTLLQTRFVEGGGYY